MPFDPTDDQITEAARFAAMETVLAEAQAPREPKRRRVEFKIDDRCVEPLEKLRAQGRISEADYRLALSMAKAKELP